jgi:hypothetical protein
MAKPRRKFSREYKLEAVRRVVNNGEPVTEVRSGDRRPITIIARMGSCVSGGPT